MSVVPFSTTDSQSTRFLFVSSIPQDALMNRLKQAFVACGDLKYIFVTFQAEHGAKILVFHDVGDSLRAHGAINMPSRSFSDIHFQARFMTSEELSSPIVQHFFRGFRQPCQAEFADAPDQFGQRLHVRQRPKKSPTPVDFEAEAREGERHSAQPGAKNTIPFPPTSPLRTSRRLSIDSSLPLLPHDSHHEYGETGRPRCTSNKFHFDSTGRRVVSPSPLRPRRISAGSDPSGLGFVDMSSSSVPPVSQSLPSSAPNPLPHLFVSTTAVQIPCLVSPRHWQEHNRIDIARIERGEDTRTSVMIKHIPNKMRRERLVKYIHEICPRKIDFLYLRIDFAKGCNAGYAFVNFIRVQDLLCFVKAKLGKKWNFFSSDKTLGMSYANYQGKAALMDRFRSSPIMAQREEWRPKVFHSRGAKRGLPQDSSAWEYRK